MCNRLNDKKRSFACCVVALALLLSFCGHQASAITAPVLAESTSLVMAAVNADGYLQPGFSSALPLVVFDASKADAPPNYENNFFLETNILLSDNGSNNTLPSVEFAGSKAAVHNLTDRENTTDKKHDYFIRFEEETQLLGLRPAQEFFALGGMDDKSLIRNYIGYAMAKEIFTNAPDIRLCELVVCDGDEYRYQGVYLLVATSPAPGDFLLQRSTAGVEMLLETYADLYDDTIGELTIPLREKAGWDDSYNESLGKLSWAEEVLYYTASRTFYQYQELFDVESFVGAFILGELTGNYTGMQNAYYYYNGGKNLISYAPLWDFSHAFDNDADKPTSPDGIHYTEATYFRQLFKSPSFANQIQTTYLQLRRVALDEQRLAKLVDDAVALVSPAVGRDWARWSEYRHVQLKPLTEIKTGEDTVREIEPFSRQSGSYENEILRMKTQLREHSLHFAVAVTQFDFQEREISKEIVLNSNPIWIVVLLVVFFLIVRFVRKYGV